MARLGCPQRSLRCSPILACWIAALFAFCAPATANVIPETCMYFNVVPGGWSDCQSSLTSCEDMTTTTSAQGQVEFQIFVQRLTLDPVTSISSDYVAWPDSWTLIGGSVCRGGTGDLYDFSYSHVLQVAFPCTPPPQQLWMALDLVFDVQGYGKLDFGGTCNLYVGCPSQGHAELTYARSAEAGTGCEYTNEPCVCEMDYYCYPQFSQPEYYLETFPGRIEHLEIPFYAGWCSNFHVHTGETWCSGSTQDAGAGHFLLELTADATGLDAGEYRSWVQVEWGSTLARCIDLILSVRGEASVETPEGQRNYRVTWGKLRALYR